MMQNNPHSGFFDYVTEKHYRSVVCLNGTLPDVSFFQRIHAPVFACDGAANTLSSIGVAPDCILGDLDSVSSTLCKEYPSLHFPDQNFSDFEKAVQHLQESALLPAIILGINGGYIDHILNNISIFASACPDCIFYDWPYVGQVFQEKTTYFLKRPPGTKLSMFALSSAKVTTSGLKWNLQQETLYFPGKSSCFNRIQADEALIEVHEGRLLVCLALDPIADAGYSA